MNSAEFVSELGKLRPSSTFLNIKGYRNSHGEIADYNIVFHISYSSALKRSILALEQVVPEDLVEAKAREQLIASFQKSLDKIKDSSIDEDSDHYLWFSDSNGERIKGVKLHIKTNTLHLYGFVVNKKVLMPGEYPKVNHRELTVAKNKLRKLCPVSKFRQFRITADQVESITVENMSLLPPE